ncbi:Laminin subunit beta-2 [Labeo rohita]|uniref:Laminin subunit beta-2 n=1 Tax=Labeo rohita TaxID=84645 RepID=A0ABQ8LGH3_LABRO|nr:Laminin subunit beta-2 [Labeo rohita]
MSDDSKVVGENNMEFFDILYLSEYTDNELVGNPRPQAETDCVQHLNNQLRKRRHHRRHIAQQQRAALRRIRQLQQTPSVSTVHRERQPGQMVTWTGPGFARVKDGAGLEFTISNIPYAMEYDIIIRYEPESTEDWEALVSVTSLDLPTSLRCGNMLPTEQMYTVTMSHHRRYVEMPRPFCFEPNNQYVVSIRFQRHGVSHRHLTAFTLIDSLVLIPRYEELPGFQGDDGPDERRRQEMELYMCLDSFMTMPMPALAELCTALICSISAIMYNGALACQCDPQGSTSAECDKVGGQCHCKPNVIGRNCDQCAPGTYGFGPNGCTVCDCHSQGSVGHQCDPVTGQCLCRHGANGRQCSECQPGQWGFPNCRQCQCNGHAESCDPETGECYECRDYTAGQLCERCVNGFYGNPMLGSGEHCRPCPCPGHPNSGNSNGASCHADYSSNQILCQCAHGYAGPRCDQCAPGFYGDPGQPGGMCRPCECNGNIDRQDPESCDSRTGQCLRCLYNTDGHSCSECKPGYYGNALAQDCRRKYSCTCVTAGTLEDYCTDGVCHCDKQTGQCPCKPNIIGHNCDQCAPNHWNFGSDCGCEPCECAQPNALSTHCNMGGRTRCEFGQSEDRMAMHTSQVTLFTDAVLLIGHFQFAQQISSFNSTHVTLSIRHLPKFFDMFKNDREFSGQCHCQPGFGGRQCSECEAFHWGDPRVQCEECNCNPLGSEMVQCDRVTGACLCKEEASGRRCNECARGFTGNFPECVPCHPCFQLWDDAVCQISRDLTHIKNVIAMILEKGEVPGVSDSRIRDLEEKLAQVQELIKDGDREGIYNLISQAIDDLRAEIALTDGRLMGVSRELNVTADLNNALKRNLTALENELKDLNNTLHRLRKELQSFLTAGLAEQFENVRKYYQSSLNSEQRCNASVYGPQSPVEQSKDTRNRTEALLKEKKDRFLRTLTANNKSLSELDEKAHEIDQKLQQLSNRVCGGQGDASADSSCPDSPCGGAGCRDSGGALKCGGKGCNGTVGASVTALGNAEDVQKNLTATSEELQTIAKKLRDIATLTQTVKNQAKDTLDKAQGKKDLFEKSNNMLKDFIQKIKDFLNEEGADPESIEKVAQQVLAISLPVNRTVMVNIVEQIKANIANLTNVEGVFNHTSEQLAKVKDLLKRAQDAKAQAEGVSSNINKTKEALETSQSAIENAEKEMTTALKNLKGAQNITTMVDNKILNLDNNLMDVMMRLANLSHEVDLLKNKTEQNREMAKDAKAQSDNATKEAAGLQKELKNVEDLYKKLKEKVDAVGEGNIDQRVTEMKKEAEELLNKATMDMKTLKELEEKLKNNKRKMLQQQNELVDLEKNVTDIKEDIRTTVMRYNNCHFQKSAFLFDYARSCGRSGKQEVDYFSSPTLPEGCVALTFAGISRIQYVVSIGHFHGCNRTSESPSDSDSAESLNGLKNSLTIDNFTVNILLRVTVSTEKLPFIPLTLLIKYRLVSDGPQGSTGASVSERIDKAGENVEVSEAARWECYFW